MRLQSAVFPLHPQLFQVKRQREQEQLRSHVCLAAREKSAEAKVGFQKSKSAFHLDGAAQPQIDAVLGGNVLLRGLAQLLQRLVYAKLLRLLRVLCLTALFPQRASLAILAAIISW